MAGENIKKYPKQSQETFNSQKSNTLSAIGEVFPVTKTEKGKKQWEQLNTVIVESKLKLSPEEVKSLLKIAKDFSEKKNTSPVSELKEIIKAKKRRSAEKKDMVENKGLLALAAKKEKKQVENKKEEAKYLREKELLLRQQRLIKAAKESYQNLSPDLKQHSPEEINTKISALSPNTKARLKRSGLSLSDYAQFSLAREKISSLDTKTPEGETFLTTLKKMEKSLGIVEKTDGGYPLSNEPRKETFEQNPQLMEFAKNDESLKSLEKVNVLDNKLNIKQQQKIFQLFWDADQKRFFDQILPLLERKKKADLDHSEPWFSAEEITTLQ